MAIESFRDRYDFLSNFYECPVFYKGIQYYSAENAFQAQKANDDETKVQFRDIGPGRAKKLGRTLPLSPDWDLHKDAIMAGVLCAKFSQNPDLAAKLLSTGDQKLIEGNYWHDNYWGDCRCQKCAGILGRNKLGKMLQAVRQILRDSNENKIN